MQNINRQAPVQCAKSILIHASPQTVWQVLTDIDSWSSWQKDIPFAELAGPLEPGTVFKWKTGGAAIKSVLHTVESYSAFGWTGKTFGLMAVHNWKLMQENDYTVVQVEESMEGWLASLFKKSFNKNLEKGMLHWLELLKQECEEGIHI